MGLDAGRLVVTGVVVAVVVIGAVVVVTLVLRDGLGVGIVVASTSVLAGAGSVKSSLSVVVDGVVVLTVVVFLFLRLVVVANDGGVGGLPGLPGLPGLEGLGGFGGAIGAPGGVDSSGLIDGGVGGPKKTVRVVAADGEGVVFCIVVCVPSTHSDSASSTHGGLIKLNNIPSSHNPVAGIPFSQLM